MGPARVEQATRTPDATRAFMPLLAAVIVVLTAVVEPQSWPYVIPLVVPVAALAVWARRDVPILPLTVVIVAAVAVSQWSSDLEAALFLLSVLALVITGWHDVGPPLIASLALVLAAPPTFSAFWPDSEVAWGIWMVGIAFPAFMGWTFHRQELLTAELAEARQALAEQAIVEERRRIARDVHDLVGHGLAAMMLQVTSARHVLRRDVDAADDALDAAEEVGRQSLGELRRTVSLLREGDSATGPPPPGLGQVDSLVASARAGGLSVERHAEGDHEVVDSVPGLTIYRIVQESLANASRHAPTAHTVVTTTVTDTDVELTVVTTGPLQPQEADADRPRYGIRGMRERAEAAGGVLQAGASTNGWTVRCTVPLSDVRRQPVAP